MINKLHFRSILDYYGSKYSQALSVVDFIHILLCCGDRILTDYGDRLHSLFTLCILMTGSKTLTSRPPRKKVCRSNGTRDRTKTRDILVLDCFLFVFVLRSLRYSWTLKFWFSISCMCNIKITAQYYLPFRHFKQYYKFGRPI